MSDHAKNPEPVMPIDSTSGAVETMSTQAPNPPRIAPRCAWPKPATTASVHPVVWVIRVVLVVSEPFRTLGRIIRYLLEEPRYASAPMGRVTVRRSLPEGLTTEPLWHPRKRVFGAFAWGGEGDPVDLAHAVLTDYLGGDPSDRLCLAFARRAFTPVVHSHQPWTLTTLQTERALRLALMEVESDARVLAA